MNPSSIMVRLTAGTSNDAVLKVAADLAKRVRATRVIGVSACQPLQIYANLDAYIPSELATWDLEREGRTILDAQVVHVRDYPNEPELRISFGNTTVKSNVAVPMRRGAEVIGAVVMGSRDVGGFSDSQVELLKTFASSISIRC